MIQKIQPFSNDPYDRPNGEWQNQPVVVQEESDQSANLQTRTLGLRASRRRFSFAVLAFVFGSLLILLNSPIRNEFLAPGPLTSNHAQILAGQGADRCAACHDMGSKRFGDWLTTAFRPGKNVQACQSTLCMKCHDKFLDASLAKFPHNVPRNQLESSTKRIQFASNQTKSDDWIGTFANASGEVECSVCHREHHGIRDLTAMTDSQCQTCHSNNYHSFETNHPEFSNWPLGRRKRIAFDHTSHAAKHFVEKGHSFDCKSCHVEDSYQNVQLLASYEQTCAKCHQKDIDGSIEEGMALVALPIIDRDAIDEFGLNVGVWPEMCSGDFDGALPDLMKVLLASDENIAGILERRGLQFDFSDLDPEIKQDVVDAVDLVWGIKKLFYNLAINGTDEIQVRLESIVGNSISQNQLSKLTQGLDQFVFAKAANRWLPGLAGEFPLPNDTHSDSLSAMVDGRGVLLFFQDESLDLLAENPLKQMVQSEGSQLSTEKDSESLEENESIELNSKPSGRSLVAESDQPSGAVGEVDGGTEENQANWLTGEIESQAPADLPLPKSSETGVNEQNESVASSNRSIQIPIERTVIPEAEKLADNPLEGFSNQLPPVDSDTGSATTLPSSQKVSPPSASVDVVDEPSGQPAAKVAQESDLPTKRKSIRSNSIIDPSELLANNPLQEQNEKLAEQVEPQVNSEQNSEPAVAEVQEVREAEPLDAHDEAELTREFVQQLDQANNEAIEDGAKSGLFEVDLQNSTEFEFVVLKQRAGWFRDDRLYQIGFKPTGHADEMLKALYELTMSVRKSDSQSKIKPVFAHLTSQSATGACIQCHTVDEQENGNYRINWRSEYRDPLTRAFTNFSHRPHVNQPFLSDCKGCHELDLNLQNAKTFEHFDSTVAVSNFSPIMKANCTNCHFEGGTNNGCTQCHSYHVGTKILIGE